MRVPDGCAMGLPAGKSMPSGLSPPCSCSRAGLGEHVTGELGRIRMRARERLRHGLLDVGPCALRQLLPLLVAQVLGYQVLAQARERIARTLG